MAMQEISNGGTMLLTLLNKVINFVTPSVSYWKPSSYKRGREVAFLKQYLLLTPPLPLPLRGGESVFPTHRLPFFEEKKCGYKILEDVTNRKKKRRFNDKRKYFSKKVGILSLI
jgi:hypothetical protein